MSLIKTYNKKQKKEDLPEISPGDEIKVYEKNPHGKPHVFKGIVIARKHGNEASATITVRGEVGKVGVERIYPIHSPNIEKIEVVQPHKVKRSKLYYLRNTTKQKGRLKRKEETPKKTAASEEQ